VALARASVPAPLPDCTPLFDAAAMREADRRAGEDHAIPSILLMERAGLASAEAALGAFSGTGAALVVVGAGNNGGDGMVVARHLAEAGWEVEVAAPGGRPPETPDGAAMAAIASSLGIGVGPLDTTRPAGARLVVDALLGTGARGAPRGEAAGAVEWIAGHDGPVLSLDVPSGVDAGSGRVEGAAVRARMTVTYHGDMVGLRVAPGCEHAGRVVVADIGIPGAVALPPTAWLVGAGAVAAVPRKGAAGDKYAAGAVLVVAGSPGLTGAASLAARATLRAGGGLTVVAVPAAVQPAVAAHLLEVMCAPLPDRDGHLAPESVERVESEARRASALAIGPGLGRAECTTEALLQILDRVALPAVLDADGLWHLGDGPERLAGRPAPTVITPHAGEAARLLGRSRDEVEAGRLDAARELARRSGAVALLKGPGTIVASPGGDVAVSAGGTPALATAGTGDVLTGTVAALLAKGMDPFRAAAAAVAAHARAGELADRGDGTIASDVLEALPAALRPPAPPSR
jgi:ADP-dependent NAD(P)H-hydrate dehydratase / NAD(P)H-hydrate epimerase